MPILSFLGNTIDTIGGVFANFFNFIVLDVTAPVLALGGFLAFLGIQYLFVRIYIYMFSRAFKGVKTLFNFLSLRYADKIQKLFDLD